MLGLSACSRPPPRLSVELTAKANAKAGVVPLVVGDGKRVQRLREIYREVVLLGRELDRVRAAARVQCRAATAERRTSAPTVSDPVTSGALECLVAPPLGASDRSAFDAYIRLMIEARSLLTQREFDKLARMR